MKICSPYFLCSFSSSSRPILGLSFALDPSSVPPSLHLSNSFLTVTCRGESPSGSLSEHHGNKVRSSVTTSDPPLTLTVPKVCADVVITRGQYYWEVDVCNSSVYWVGKKTHQSILLLLLVPSQSIWACARAYPHSHTKTCTQEYSVNTHLHTASTTKIRACNS